MTANLRLGINTCFALKRWPRPDDWAAIVRDELGLELVELTADLLEGMESVGSTGPASAAARRAIERTRTALDRHGLTADTTFTGLAAFGLNLLMHPDPESRRAAIDWYTDFVGVAAELGCIATGGHVGTMSTGDWENADRREARWSELRDAMAEIAARAHDKGLEYLMVENLPARREPSTIDGIRSLVTAGDEGHSPWRLCFDVGHTCVAGGTAADLDPYVWIGRFGPAIPEIQLQQTDGRGDHHWQFSAARNRDGIVDADRMLDAIDGAGMADARLILEIIPPGELPDDEALAELRESVEYWRTAIGARGGALGASQEA